MHTSQASASTRFKVGLFTLFGLFMIGAMTILVNNRPFWWKPCQLVRISVEDATGLKMKSPVRSLGIEIGYLKTVMLHETHVTLGICLTAPVEVLPTTRAYLKGEGFLGDKFVELRPVKYNANVIPTPNGSVIPGRAPSSIGGAVPDHPDDEQNEESQLEFNLLEWLLPSAHAADAVPAKSTERKPGHSGREIPVGDEGQDVQHLVTRVDELVQQMSGLTDNLKRAIDPEDLRRTMKQLNSTLENASKTLSPEGGLNQTAQRTLAKLEDSIEQLRDLMTRVNKGEGSVGMLLNDPTYAQEIMVAIKNINLLLNRVQNVRFVPDLGAVYMGGIGGARGWFHLGVWPKPDRYYLLGIGSDSRGAYSKSATTTTVGGGTPVTVTSQTTNYSSLFFTAMMGKVFFNRLDAAVGLLYGDGAISAKYNFWTDGWTDRLQLGTDFYLRIGGNPDARVYANFQPIKGIYVRGGLESFASNPTGNGVEWMAGAGLTFDDEDIKLLFALK